MLFSNKDREDFQNLEELVTLDSRVKAIKLQDRLGKQVFFEDSKKVFGRVTKSFENTTQVITKLIVETSNKNNEALEKLNNKNLEITNGRGILASYLMSPLSKNTHPEKSSQFNLVKESKSIRVNDLKMNKTIPITLYNNLLTLRDTGKKLQLKGDLLKKIPNNNYNVNHASLSDKKLGYEFAKEMNFDVQAPGKKST